MTLRGLGIKETTMLSVKISDINRTILRSWWDPTGHEGKLEEIDDVQRVDDVILQRFIATM